MAEHPHGYPVLGALIGWPFGSEMIGLRIVSAMSLLVIIFSIRGLLRRHFSPSLTRDQYVLLALALSPFLLRYSLVVMSDVPAMALILLAFAALLRWHQQQTRPCLLVPVVFAFVAIGVRLAVAPLVLGMIASIIHGRVHQRKQRWLITLMIAAVVVTVAYTFIPSALLHDLLQRSPLGGWSPQNAFSREQHSDDGVLTYRLPNMIYVLGVFVHPGFLPIGVLLLPFVRVADLKSMVARTTVWLLGCYLLFIAGMPFQNDRVLLLALPFVVVLLYPAFQRAWAFAMDKWPRPVLWVGILAFIHCGLFVRAMAPFIKQAAVERELADQVAGLHPQHIYTHGMGGALSNYCDQVPVTELWYGVLDSFPHGALLVVHPENLALQWKGKPPLINWQRALLQNAQQVIVRPDGWVIARIP